MSLTPGIVAFAKLEMLIALTIVTLLASIVTTSAVVYASFRFAAVLRSEREAAEERIAEALTTLVTAKSESEPAPLAVLADQIATVFAARIMQQLMARIAGMSSGAAKAEAAEAETALASQSPGLALLSQLIPKKFKKRLLSNPQMVGQLGQLGMFGGNHSDESSMGGSIRDRL